MDFNQLLNTSTPFDQNKLAILEQVINIFYAPLTSPQDRQAANKLLDQFQKLDTSFQYCEFILNNTQSNNTRVLALNIYETFIKEKWNLLDNDSKLNLRNFLVGLLIKFVLDKTFYENSQNHFVINKLNIVIVLIAKNEWTTTWPNFISELCSSSKSDPNLCENNMKLLILLSEEINVFWKNSLTAKKAYELREKMSKEFIEVFNLCQLIMNNSNSVSKNLLIKGNILKVINQDYNSKFGKAVGIGLSTDSSYDIEEVEIQNNIIIGCRIGIYYFITGIGSYKSVKIYHNTIWMIDITPIWFTEPINPSSKSELFNNFIYHKKQYQLSTRSVWDIGYNMYYNTEKIPSQFDDTESNKGSSQAIKQMNLSEIFNNNNGDCDYSNANIKINCFRPNPNNKGNGNIYHKGKRIKDEEKDLEGCKRDTNPSIGAFEFPDGCQKDPEPPETDTDVPDTDIPEVVYDVKFKIDYRTDGSMKLVGSLCDWKPEGCYKMILEGNNIWTYTLNSGTKYTFKYKFLEYKGSNNYRWETNNRLFNGEILAELAEKSSSGTYENCKYVKNGNVITYTCYWQ